MALDTERARRWIATLGVHRQGRGLLVARAADGGLCFCWIGTGAECAAADGYTRRVDRDNGPKFLFRRWDDNTPTVYGAISAWLGVDDILDIRCHIDQLPDGLRHEVRQDLAKTHARTPLLDDLERMEQCDRLGHPLWLLNDCGVLAPTLADVMRVVLDIDRDEVPA